MWGVNKNRRIYFSSGSGQKREDERAGAWWYVAGHLKQIAVSGSAVWGVTRNDRIFYRNGYLGKWRRVGGRLKQIAVSGTRVWGVTRSNRVYYRKGRAGRWKNIPGRLKQIAVSMDHVWGLSPHGHVFHRRGQNGRWKSMSGVNTGRLKEVAVSGEHVWGVTQSGAVYTRHGTGGTWLRINGLHLNRISVSAGSSEPSTPGCWYLQQHGCHKHPGMTGARGLWHRDHHQWARQSHHACLSIRKKQIDQWCKSSSTMHFIAAKPNHEGTVVKEQRAKLARLEAQRTRLQANLQATTRLQRQALSGEGTEKRKPEHAKGQKATEPQKKPCPLPVPRWEQQASKRSNTRQKVVPWWEQQQAKGRIQHIIHKYSAGSQHGQLPTLLDSHDTVTQLATHVAHQVAQHDRISWKQIDEEVGHQVRGHLQE